MNMYCDGNLQLEGVQVADSFLSRFVGLMGKTEQASPKALLIRPCNSIHTFFMRFAIDVVFLDAQGKVLRIRRAVPPGRILWPVPDAMQVLELKTATSIKEGDRLEFKPL